MRVRRGGATLRVAILAVAAASLLATATAAREVVVVSGGAAIPLGETADFTDVGASIEIRFRHFNTGHSAWELSVGYFAAPLSGVIPETVESYEALVRTKNLAAQQQSGPGQGYLVAEYGSLDGFDVTANFLYRFSQRGRFSPIASVGGGVYHWSVPFRLRFYQVPSFGEQHAYDPMGTSGYQFIFDDELDPQVINFSKDETSGGLNAALGIDFRATRTWGIEAEARAHLLFSSGEGVQEDPADNQSYLNNMSFLRLQGTLYYRF